MCQRDCSIRCPYIRFNTISGCFWECFKKLEPESGLDKADDLLLGVLLSAGDWWRRAASTLSLLSASAAGGSLALGVPGFLTFRLRLVSTPSAHWP